MSAHVWTTGDDRTLRALWGRDDAYTIAARIGCNWRTVYEHAARLGLHIPKRRRYKPGELGAIAYALAMAGEGWTAMGARLDRAAPNLLQAAKKHAEDHGLPPVPSKVTTRCTPRWAAMLGQVPDTVIAARAGVDRSTVYSWRRARGIPVFVGTAWVECEAAK